MISSCPWLILCILFTLTPFLYCQSPSNASVNTNSSNLLSDPLQCTQFGPYCSNCTADQCTGCSNQNLTLSQNCQCLSPYINTTWLQNGGSTDQLSPYLISRSPCILCTDRFSLDDCSPAMYGLSYQVDGNFTNFVVSFNRNRDSIVRNLTLALLKMAYGLYLSIDNTEIPVSNVTEALPCSVGGYCIAFKVNGLDNFVYQHYAANGYAISVNYTVKIKKKVRVYLNGTSPMPQSYRAEVMFKSLQNGFEVDSTFSRYYSGRQSINFNLVFPTPPQTPSPSPINQSNSSSSPSTPIPSVTPAPSPSNQSPSPSAPPA